MSKLIGAAVIGQSGGPSSVINASAYGAIKTALECEEITNVYGMCNGIVGLLNDNLIDMGKEDPDELALMKYTPSSALGSCRYKLADPDVDETDYIKILEMFKKYNIRYFFYNGGNDSMDTCNKISKFMLRNGYEVRCMGIPKTIDNDLAGTDHCPGFASAAKFIATSVMEVYRDSTVYDTGMITIIEIMGRHAGWLAGAAALAKLNCQGPMFIYLPEIAFDMEQFFIDLDNCRKKHKRIVIVMSEGIKDKTGMFISEYGINDTNVKDSFGHVQLGGLAATMANIIRNRTGAKVRGIELSLLQRCAAHCASKTDRDEAFMAGKTAVEAAVAGESGKMVAFRRDMTNGYKCVTELVPLSEVANVEKLVPREWINEEGNNVNEKFIEYAMPLIQGQVEQTFENGMPKYAHLKRVKAEV